jgi:CheY-like chemotaxis protein
MIMVIEDASDMRYLISEILTGEGHQVIGAENGEDGLQKLRNMGTKPQVILLDLMMPMKDGATFRAEQLEDAELAQIPVILMSADSKIEAIKNNLQIRHYLKKPIEIDDLIDTVAKVIEVNHGSQLHRLPELQPS